MAAARALSLLAAAVLLAASCSQSPLSVTDADAGSSVDPATGSNADLMASDELTGEDETEQPNGDGEPSSDDAAAGGVTFDPAPDGYLVWAHAVEPVTLTTVDPVGGGLYTTSWIREGLLEGLYRTTSDWEQVPELLAGDASVVVNNNNSVSITYRLRSDLTWSDGQPLTSADVEFTHRILLEGCLTEADGSAIDVSNEGCVFPMADRTGYDLVTSFTVTDDATFTINMAAFYPDWRSLYGQIFAEHSFGEDASTVAANLETMTAGGRPLPASGPLILQNWSDHSMRLARNESYHGAGPAGDAATADGDDEDDEIAVEGVQINFVGTPEVAVSDVTAGSADLAIVGSDLDVLGDLDPGVEAIALPAIEFEHLGLNLLNPHLADPLVRQAVARAVDRSALASVLGDIVGDGVSAEGVGNMFWLPGQAGYQDHQPEALAADLDGARDLIGQVGYVRTADGTYRHPDRGTLFLRLLTNSADPLRTALQEQLIAQLSAAGFEVRADNRSGGAYLTEGPFSAEAMEASQSAGAGGRPDVWDLVVFPWAAGPWPGLQSGAFRGGSGANPYGYQNAEFDAEASRCDGLADDTERTSCYQDLDTFVTTLDRGDDGLFVVPLVERPQILIYNRENLSAVPPLVDGPTGGPLPDIGGYLLR